MLFVQQLHINLLAGFHITRQADNLLLRFWHCRHAGVEFGLFIFQRFAFFQQCAVSRVRFGVQLGNLRLFKGQFIKLRIDVNHRIEHRFRFQWQVDRVLLLTIGVEFVFGHVQFGAHFRQLFIEELQAFRRLFGFTLNVLLQVVAGNTVQNIADLIAIFSDVGKAEHTGIFAVLGHAQVVLQIIDHPECREFGHGEFAVVRRLNGAYQHGHTVLT